MIILAAGSGKRMAGVAADKLLLPLNGKNAWLYGWESIESSGIADAYWVVYRDSEQRVALESSLAQLAISKPIEWVVGGAERMDSVYAALEVIPAAFEWVFIHDAARPLIHCESILALQQAVIANDAAVLAKRPKDTLKRIPLAVADQQACHLEDLDRSRLWAVETPQAFRRELIAGAYRKVREKGIAITDDTAALEVISHPVAVVENRFPNPKLTTPDDIPLLSALKL